MSFVPSYRARSRLMGINRQSSGAFFRKMWRNGKRIRTNRQATQSDFFTVSGQRYKVFGLTDLTLTLGFVDFTYHTVKSVEE